MNKLIILLFLALIPSFCIYNSFIPIKYSNSCNDENLFRYRFGVYKIKANMLDSLEREKLGGFSKYLGIDKVPCLDTILKAKLTAQKKSIDSLHNLQGWRSLNCGLWINKKGDIAFKSDYLLRGDTRVGLTASRFMTHFGFDEEINPTLKSVIDTATFKQLTYSFYRDKNNIYQYYPMSGGGRFSDFKEVEPKLDVATFKVLNDNYAMDENFVYDGRQGLMANADVKTFIVLNDEPFAKDKTNYYQWDGIIEKEEQKDSSVKEAIKKLNTLKNEKPSKP
ncbi:MAG: hypothetical protein ABIP95_12035 [Pelobium sp.]